MTPCSSVCSLSLPLTVLRLNTVRFPYRGKTFQSCHPRIKGKSRGEVPFSICLNISFYYLHINYHVKALNVCLDIKHGKLFWKALLSYSKKSEAKDHPFSRAMGNFLPVGLNLLSGILCSPTA